MLIPSSNSASVRNGFYQLASSSLFSTFHTRSKNYSSSSRICSKTALINKQNVAFSLYQIFSHAIATQNRNFHTCSTIQSQNDESQNAAPARTEMIQKYIEFLSSQLETSQKSDVDKYYLLQKSYDEFMHLMKQHIDMKSKDLVPLHSFVIKMLDKLGFPEQIFELYDLKFKTVHYIKQEEPKRDSAPISSTNTAEPTAVAEVLKSEFKEPKPSGESVFIEDKFTQEESTPSVIKTMLLPPFDLPTFTNIIVACGRMTRFEDVEELYTYIKQQGFVLDRLFYNSLLSALVHQGDISDSLKKMREMQKAQIEPDLETFKILLQTCEKQKSTYFTQIVEEFREMPQVPKNQEFFDAYLKTVSRVSKNVQLALKIIDEMKLLQLNVGDEHQELLLDCCIAERKRNTALDIYESYIKQGRQPPSPICDKLLMCFGQEPDSQVLKVYEGMKDSNPNFVPSSNTFNALILNAIRNNKIEKAKFFLNQMRKQGLKPNVTTYNTIFNQLYKYHWKPFLVQIRNSPRRSLFAEVVREMKNSMSSSASGEKSLEEGLEFTEWLTQYNMQENVVNSSKEYDYFKDSDDLLMQKPDNYTGLFKEEDVVDSQVVVESVTSFTDKVLANVSQDETNTFGPIREWIAKNVGTEIEVNPTTELDLLTVDPSQYTRVSISAATSGEKNKRRTSNSKRKPSAPTKKK